MSNTATLARDWLDAKQAEDNAKAKRLKIEAELTEAFDVPQEGQKTHKIDGYAISLKGVLYRKLDVDAWEKVKSELPENLRPVKTKLEADAKGMKYLANNEPELWAKIASAFETKPGKTGVTVKELPNGD